MYYPYFRGKQFDLLAIKESAQLFAKNNFTPIIEPVRESLNGLKRSIEALTNEGASAVLIVNPLYGDHTEKAEAIQRFVIEELNEHRNISVGILLNNETSLDEILQLCEEYVDRPIYFIHCGFAEARSLAEATQARHPRVRHIFIDNHSSKPYRKHFADYERILLRNGFKRQANRKYPDTEFFSDLHVTFEDEGVNGFGDYLIVGDEYSETGGPAYAVAIHITFIDPNMDDVMYIHHFKSIRQDTPTDPAGKFYEALTKLVEEVQKPDSKILKTSAIEEFIELYNRQHFPGLGYIKKLSMKHHIELMSDYLGR
ncbi:sce7725 family protein [Pseudomonas sp. WAC2]|uniref:sce7725 family protein n=1 Tax=Pseudomonas sp. WAC2 TaxID=3055057 RepID=UPI0025B18F51|nr:sce7725 family protein [Pseudomonas sp. WAC2]MDN3236071.1 sce7725 family protein [Pseudomonas sp. WAC2]